MLAPASIAIVGASPKPESLGNRVSELLRCHDYPGNLYFVNPKYQEISGIRCYDELKSLPGVPDLVVMVIGNHSMEAQIDQCIALGAGGVVIFANNYLADDHMPPLLMRLKQKARQAGMPICGGNGMGFYNYDANTLVSFDCPPPRPAGHIAMVAHSGSVMTYLANTDPRLMFNLAISPGQEIHGSVADYMLYALDQASTRVLAVFIETVRDPDQFITALKTARQKEIPVVIVKVGSTEKSARMAASHSGAVAGSDAAFQAVCDKYGAIRVQDMDQLAATVLAFCQGRKIGSGKLSSLLDSGGLREQMIDLADQYGVEFTDLAASSKRQLERVLEYGLIAENPVDAMGAINVDVASLYQTCLQTLHDDPGTAMISLEFEFRDGFSQYPTLLDIARDFYQHSEKPMVIINSLSLSNNAQTARELGIHGIPVINGVANALAALGNLFHYRDHHLFPPPQRLDVNHRLLGNWKKTLQDADHLGEEQALRLFNDFGLPVVSHKLVDSGEQLAEAIRSMSFPMALKTAQPGLLHKTDQDGVKLNLQNPKDVEKAYSELSHRLGARAIVAEMVTGGVELAFGMVNDDQFGPMVMISAGGVLVELLDDRRFIPAPFGVEEALSHIRQLKVYPLLEGARGKAPCDVNTVARALSDFSLIVDALKNEIQEIDINPVITTEQGCTIVDAIVIS